MSHALAKHEVPLRRSCQPSPLSWAWVPWQLVWQRTQRRISAWIWEMLMVSSFFVLCSGWVSRHRHQIIMCSCCMRQISWDMIRRIIQSCLWPWDVWPPTYCDHVEVSFLNAQVSRRNCSAWTLFNAFHEAFLSLACHVSWVLPLLHHQEHTHTPLSKKPCKS